MGEIDKKIYMLKARQPGLKAKREYFLSEGSNMVKIFLPVEKMALKYFTASVALEKSHLKFLLGFGFLFPNPLPNESIETGQEVACST